MKLTDCCFPCKTSSCHRKTLTCLSKLQQPVRKSALWLQTGDWTSSRMPSRKRSCRARKEAMFWASGSFSFTIAVAYCIGCRIAFPKHISFLLSLYVIRNDWWQPVTAFLILFCASCPACIQTHCLLIYHHLVLLISLPGILLGNAPLQCELR